MKPAVIMLPILLGEPSRIAPSLALAATSAKAVAPWNKTRARAFGDKSLCAKLYSSVVRTSRVAASTLGAELAQLVEQPIRNRQVPG